MIVSFMIKKQGSAAVASLWESQYLAQEVLQAGVLRMLEDIRRAALLDELAVSHEQNAVADLAGEAHLVRDDDHRHAVVRQLLHDLQNLADHLRVERARRLVEEHDLRLHHERADDGHALLLSAGQLRGVRISAVTETDALQQLRGEGYTLLAVEQVEKAARLTTFEVEKGKKYALVFGNEVDGVAQEAVDLCDGAVEIPQQGTKHSLNVAVSGGVVLWGFFRQMVLF